jgi:cobalt-zinc-cadmium efflux system outer membrane protein
MSHRTRCLGMVLGVILFALSAGCAVDQGSLQQKSQTASGSLPTQTNSLTLPKPQINEAIQQVSANSSETLDNRSAGELHAAAPAQLSDDRDLFADAKTLSPARLIDIVLERNPTLDQMRATAEAAQSRYPQVTSLDDPMLGLTTAPGSAWSNNLAYAARVEITQKLPYSGKRELRGRVALAEASAAAREVDDSRLQLIEAAWNAYAGYSFAEQALIVNKENLTILGKIREDASTRYKNNLAPQQDRLQADVEIARQQEKTVILERTLRVAKARLTTLMHLPPDSPLPPPENMPPATEVSDVAELRAKALAARPDFKILSDRLAAEDASLALAMREYKPDVELMAAYDGFWQGQGQNPLQWQLGAKINLPVRLARRDAAVAEAQARLRQRRAELARLTDQINFQVQQSFELLQESEKIIDLYNKTLLPAAEANVKEARASYVNSKIPFVSLAEAQRSLVSLKERYFEALADAMRRRAALERDVGGAIEKTMYSQKP